MIVVDSSVWIANLRGLDTGPVRRLRQIEDLNEVLVGDLILMEVLQGARDERHAARIEQAMRAFPIAPMLDAGLAVPAAANFRRLRGIGITVRKTIDVIIATFCIEGAHTLLHDDRDFEPFTEHLGLRTA